MADLKVKNVETPRKRLNVDVQVGPIATVLCVSSVMSGVVTIVTKLINASVEKKRIKSNVTNGIKIEDITESK